MLSPPVNSFVAARAYKSRSEALLKFSALFWKLKFEETLKLWIAGRKYVESGDVGADLR